MEGRRQQHRRGMEAKKLTNGGNNTSDKESWHAKTPSIKGFAQAVGLVQKTHNHTLQNGKSYIVI